MTITIPTWIKEPWFKWLAICVAILAILIGGYYYAKKVGRDEEKQRRGAMVTESLKKAQDALIVAQRINEEAASEEAKNEKLQGISTTNKKEAEKKEAQYNAVHEMEKQQITETYEKNKEYINRDMSDCDRCRDICTRSNNIAIAYGPDFAEFACDVSTQCSAACE